MDYKQLEEQRQVSALKAALIPVCTAYVAYWYTSSARWSVVAFIVALVMEGVLSACALSSSISQDEERRGGDMQ